MGSELSSNTWSVGPSQVLNSNAISIGSAVFAGLTIVTDRQTDHATRPLTIDRICVHSTTMRSKNYLTWNQRPKLLTPQSLLTLTTRVPCSNATKKRNPLKFAGVPQTRRSQPLVGRSSPYCGDIWRRYCCLKMFFRLSIRALVAKI